MTQTRKYKIKRKKKSKNLYELTDLRIIFPYRQYNVNLRHIIFAGNTFMVNLFTTNELSANKEST